MEHDEFGLRASRRIRVSDNGRVKGGYRKTGDKVKYDAGHPPEECQATVVEQRKGVHQRTESAEAEACAAAAKAR